MADSSSTDLYQSIAKLTMTVVVLAMAGQKAFRTAARVSELCRSLARVTEPACNPGNDPSKGEHSSKLDRGAAHETPRICTSASPARWYHLTIQ